MENDNLRWFTSSCGRIEFQMPIEQAQSVCHTGQCIDDVKALSKMDNIKAITDELDPEIVKIVIREAYGDITDEELDDHEGNIERLLWIAGCDIDEHESDDEESEYQEPFTYMHYADWPNG